MPGEPTFFKLPRSIYLITVYCSPTLDVFLLITGLIFEAVQSLFDCQRRPGDIESDKFTLVHDCHGQNILLELDNKGLPRRIIFRDFQHMYGVILEEGDEVNYLAEQNPFCKVLDIRQEPEYVRKKLSQLVDCKLGTYVIRRLIDELTACFGYEEDRIIAEVRGSFGTP